MSTSGVVPFIDAHCHTHTRSFDDWETLGATGCAALVISAGVPNLLHLEVHEEMPDLADLRYYWGQPIRFAPLAEAKHYIKVYVAIGLSSMSGWKDWEKALELMPEYLKDPHVIGIGEIGLDPRQIQYQWPMEEQEVALAEQTRIAKQHDVPLILHTPTPPPPDSGKRGGDRRAESVAADVPRGEYKLHYLKKDLEIINRAGLSHELLIVDHSDETTIEWTLRETGAYVGISVGSYFRVTDPHFFAEVIDRHGPERIIVNTDHAAQLSCDILAVPTAIREMRRRGIEEEAIRRSVFDNANNCFRMGLEHG